MLIADINLLGRSKARDYVWRLLGDADWKAPDGRPYWHYFAGLHWREADAAFKQIKQLNEWDYLRDLMERMEVDANDA